LTKFNDLYFLDLSKNKFTLMKNVVFLFLFSCSFLSAQQQPFSGNVNNEGTPVKNASVSLYNRQTTTDSLGFFKLDSIPVGKYKI